MRVIIGVICMLLPAMSSTALARPSLRPLLDAIRQVESGDREDVVGDGGRSIGPYQIQRPYWQDSGIPGKYGNVRNTAYAERVMIAYWQRYCPDALSRGDWQCLARTHNGGPNGDRSSSTLKYWTKVRREMGR